MGNEQAPEEELPKKKGRAKQACVYHDSFDDSKMARKIMARAPEGGRKPTRPPKGTPVELQYLWRQRLLTREQEKHLFRQYNYLRYKAERLKDTKSERNKQRRERFLSQANDIRNRLLEANLRLVVAPAKSQVYRLESMGLVDPRAKFNTLLELISDGNMYLGSAVDAFDFARGFRFSTYAMRCMSQNFRRDTSAWLKRGETVPISSMEESIESCSDDGELSAAQAKVLVESLLDRLEDPRDALVLKMRFFEGKTLEQAGNEFDPPLTRERIRQIEKRAYKRARWLYRSDRTLSKDSFFVDAVL